MKRSRPRRDWTEARAKVESEGKCRNCGGPGTLEAAHIIGRKHDKELADFIPNVALTESSNVLYVAPVRIVPLCAYGCHVQYDAHNLDLLGKLTPEEEAQAVLDAGSLESARRRLAPTLYRQERETDAA